MKKKTIKAFIAVDTLEGNPVSYLTIVEKAKDLKLEMPYPLKKGFVKAVPCTITY
jgi:hypothetical protein